MEVHRIVSYEFGVSLLHSSIFAWGILERTLSSIEHRAAIREERGW